MVAPTEEANVRARELFTSLLTPEEKKEWQQTLKVTVTGSEGGVYQLRTHAGCTDNIIQINPETGEGIAALCVAPNMWPTGVAWGRVHLPMADAWAGQLLGIRYNERHLQRTACITRYRSRYGGPSY